MEWFSTLVYCDIECNQLCLDIRCHLTFLFSNTASVRMNVYVLFICIFGFIYGWIHFVCCAYDYYMLSFLDLSSYICIHDHWLCELSFVLLSFSQTGASLKCIFVYKSCVAGYGNLMSNGER